MGCYKEKWLKKQLEEIFTPPTKDWDELRLWVYRFGDDWDIFLIELTIPKLLEETDGKSIY
jgi:hypothetical protein